MFPSLRRRLRTGASGTALAVAAATVAALPAAPQALAEPEPDYCAPGGCHDILPPGQNGSATLVEILGHQVFGTRPQHASSQLDMYDNLVHHYDGLTEEGLDDFFLDAGFGVAPDDVGRRYQPRDDVTITRDADHGIPHVEGTTREGTMFGAGYAAAEDRLFLMDVLRRVGRGELTSFAGGAEGNRGLNRTCGAAPPTPRRTSRRRSTGSPPAESAVSRPSSTSVPTWRASTPTSRRPTTTATSPASTS